MLNTALVAPNPSEPPERAPQMAMSTILPSCAAWPCVGTRRQSWLCGPQYHCRRAMQSQCPLLTAPGLSCRLSPQVQCAAQHAESTLCILQLPGQAIVLASAAGRSLQKAGQSSNSNIKLMIRHTQCQSLICAQNAGCHMIVKKTADHTPAAICTTQSPWPQSDCCHLTELDVP